MSLSGKLDARGHPRLDLVLRGPFGYEQRNVVIDTGFTGAVGVPEAVADRLGLRGRGHRPTLLADGRLHMAPIYLLDVDWVNGTVIAEALETSGTEVLIGAGLLRGHQLAVDYGETQSVEIR